LRGFRRAVALMTKKQYAIVALRKQGYNVFALSPNSKLPNGSWKKWQNEKCNESIPNRSNYAVVCGYNNLVVLDLDNPELSNDFGEFLNKTWITKTGKGFHIYLRHCNSNLPNTLRLKNQKNQRIDVQSSGAYVVGAGSIHPDTNNEYEIVCDKPVMEIDFHEIVKKLFSLGFKPDQKKTLVELRKPSPEGQRNQDLFDYLKEYRKLNNTPKETLWQIAKDRNSKNSKPLSDLELETIFESNFSYDFGKITTAFIEEQEKKAAKQATEYTKEFLEKYHFATLNDTEEVLCYQDGIYKPRGEILIKGLCQQKSEKCSNHIVREVIGKIQRSTYKSREEFDKDPHIINLKNGLLDIQTGKLTEHSPDKRYRIQLPVKYNPKACPFNFIKALSQWLPDGRDRITIIEQAANILLRKSGLEIVSMYNGIGSNGKSTYGKFLSKFLGKENITSISMQDIVSNRFAAAQLDGKLANIYPDLENSELEHIGKFKLIVSGDNIQVEKKGKDSFVMSPFAKHFFSTNKIPQIADDTDALYRRFQVTDWTQQFLRKPSKKELEDGILPENRNLLDTLCTENEFSGFLNLLIITAKRLQKQTHLTFPQSIQEVRAIMKENADHIQKFAKECLIEDISEKESKTLVFRAYGYWARQNHENVITDRKFNSKLKRLLNIESLETKTRVRGYTNPVAVWSGVKIRDEIYEKICSNVPDVPLSTTEKTKQNKQNILFSEINQSEQPERLEQGVYDE